MQLLLFLQDSLNPGYYLLVDWLETSQYSPLAVEMLMASLDLLDRQDISTIIKEEQGEWEIASVKKMDSFSVMSQQRHTLSKANLFLLTLGCREETLDIASRVL